MNATCIVCSFKSKAFANFYLAINMHTTEVAGFAFTIVLFSSTLINGNLIRHKREVCQSEECKVVSDYILSKLDTSVDPCQDMYQFSCGRWPDMSKVDNNTDSYSLLGEVQNNIDQQLFQILQEEGATFRCKNSSAIRKLKHLYQSCVNFKFGENKAILHFIEFIDSHGSWTVTKTKQPWDDENWSLQEALSNAHKIWGTSFWKISVRKDNDKSLRNIIRFIPPLFWSFSINKKSSQIQEHLMQMSLAFGKLEDGDKEIVEEKLSKVLAFQDKLQKITLESLKGLDKLSRLMTLGELQEILGSWINIQDYMAELFGVRKITLMDEVDVTVPGYFSKLKKVIQETCKETIANYVMLNLITQAFKYLEMKKNPDALESLSNYVETEQNIELNANVEDSSGDADETKTKEQATNVMTRTRQKECLDLARKSLPFLTSALFVDTHLSVETITKIVTAIDDIEHEFINEIEQIVWLDDITRKILIEKAKSMSNRVGYPDWILNPEKLDAKYENLVIHDNNFLKNMVHINEFERKKEFNSYFRSPEENGWQRNPEEVNAYYNLKENEMVILAGILQSPLVSPYYPRSLLYGGIGTVLGHELIHGFDNEGRLYNKDGIYGDTWTPHVAEEFDKLAKCFVDQYSSYSLYNISVNGDITLGENIADNGGMKIAYRAYESSINPHDLSLPGLDFTDDQLFFIGMSQFWCAHFSREKAIDQLHKDNHSPAKFRVIGSMANSKEFAEAFKCAKNTPMNPEKKCEIW